MQAASPPIRQPLKKMRAGGTPGRNDATDDRVDDAIARRRAQIQKLQQQQAQQSAVMSKAQVQLNGHGVPPRGRLEVRDSDLFPSAPKSTSRPKPGRTIPVGPSPPVGAPPMGGPPIGAPPMGIPPVGAPPMGKSKKEGETVARRLDATFSTNSSSRSKSAPPARPNAPRPPKSPRPPGVSFAASPRPPTSIHPSPASKKPDVVDDDEDAIPPPVETPAFKSFAQDPAAESPANGSAPPNVGTPYPGKPAPKGHAGGTPFPTKGFSGQAGSTPFPGTRSMVETPESEVSEPSGKAVASATRLQILQNMSQVAKTMAPPSTANSQTPELRMQKELIRSENEKAEMLKKVASLEDQVQKLQQHSVDDILRVADSQGDAAAVKLAREQAAGRPSHRTIGFLSPALSSPLLSPRRRHVPTPHPKSQRQREVDRQLLKRATKDTVHEYESDMATFIVRRPYGVASERDLWFGAGQQPAKLYEKSADASKASTLEVVARIEADGSLLSLYEDAHVQHQVNDEWKDYGNAEDEPLGNIMYIDKDANEREYCLDEVYQGARAVREHYCTAIATMLSAIEQKGKMEADKQPGTTVARSGRDIGVNTDSVVIGGEKREKKKEKKKQAPPPPEERGVMTVFIGMFFDFIKSVLYFFLIGLPFRLFMAVFVTLVSGLIVATLWLYMADDLGAGSLGIGMNANFYNPPGIV